MVKARRANQGRRESRVRAPRTPAEAANPGRKAPPVPVGVKDVIKDPGGNPGAGVTHHARADRAGGVTGKTAGDAAAVPGGRARVGRGTARADRASRGGERTVAERTASAAADPGSRDSNGRM